MPSCAAYGCQNTTDKAAFLGNYPHDASFHTFPLKKPKLLRQWLNNLGRKDFVPTKASRVCSAHFHEDSFVKKADAMAKARLKEDAVPTIFSLPSEPTSSRTSTERTERRERRIPSMPMPTPAAVKKRKTVTETVIKTSEVNPQFQVPQTHTSDPLVAAVEKCDTLGEFDVQSTIPPPLQQGPQSLQPQSVSQEEEQIFPTTMRVPLLQKAFIEPVQVFTPDQLLVLKQIPKPAAKKPHTVTRSMQEQSNIESEPYQPFESEMSPPSQPFESEMTPPSQPFESEMTPPSQPFKSEMPPPSQPFESEMFPPPQPLPIQTIPEIAVHSLFGTPRRTALDHAYYRRKAHVKIVGTQTTPSKDPKPPQILHVDSPKELSSPISSPFHSEGFEEALSDFKPLPESSSSESSSTEEKTTPPSEKRKFIVFEDNLEELHNFCKLCGQPTVERASFTKGSMLGYRIVCQDGHSYVWHSQPQERKQPLGNLLLTAAILFSGGTFGKFRVFADIFGLIFFSKTVFNKLQKNFVLPVIQERWEMERKKACDELKPLSSIVLAGDGRCDSPGHSAKYGSYSLMHADGSGSTGTRKIVSLKLVQVSEVKNSNHLEPEGMKRCLQELDTENLKFDVLATNRHLMISKIMRTEYKKIDHQFDVWHVAKGVIKKLTAKAKSKECTQLLNWIQSVSNHLWWACATCDGNAQLLREKWISILHHVTNDHQWSDNQLFHHCDHPPLSDEDRRSIRWLKPKSDSFLALKKVVMDTRLLKALEQLTKFCHTGELEVFHNMLLKFCSKRQHFQYEAMTGRLMLAAIEWNNTQREQAVDTRGKPATSVEYSKRRKTFVLKNRYIRRTSNYARELLDRTQEIHRLFIQLPEIEKPELPKNVAPVPKPNKEDLEESFRSRFT